MKTLTRTLTLTTLVAATLTGALVARADEAAKPAAPTPTPEAPKAESPKAEAPAALEKAKIDWEKMSKDEHKKYMKATVLPAAKKIFAAYDAKKFSKVTCATCHGPAAATGSFEMPNPELPKIPATHEAFKKLAAKKPEMVKFMGQVVEPQVAALLGLDPWTPQNPKGFACVGCHELSK